MMYPALCWGIPETRFGIEPGELIGRRLHRRRLDSEALRQIVPAVGNQVRERFSHEPVAE